MGCWIVWVREAATLSAAQWDFTETVYNETQVAAIIAADPG
jgi:hypothetical protein